MKRVFSVFCANVLLVVFLFAESSTGLSPAAFFDGTGGSSAAGVVAPRASTDQEEELPGRSSSGGNGIEEEEFPVVPEPLRQPAAPKKTLLRNAKVNKSGKAGIFLDEKDISVGDLGGNCFYRFSKVRSSCTVGELKKYMLLILIHDPMKSEWAQAELDHLVSAPLPPPAQNQLLAAMRENMQYLQLDFVYTKASPQIINDEANNSAHGVPLADSVRVRDADGELTLIRKWKSALLWKKDLRISGRTRFCQDVEDDEQKHEAALWAVRQAERKFSVDFGLKGEQHVRLLALLNVDYNFVLEATGNNFVAQGANPEKGVFYRVNNPGGFVGLGARLYVGAKQYWEDDTGDEHWAEVIFREGDFLTPPGTAYLLVEFAAYGVEYFPHDLRRAEQFYAGICNDHPEAFGGLRELTKNVFSHADLAAIFIL